MAKKCEDRAVPSRNAWGRGGGVQKRARGVGYAPSARPASCKAQSRRIRKEKKKE